jgi:hypothetical protein
MTRTLHPSQLKIPASLPNLSKRTRTRVVVPPGVVVHARFNTGPRGSISWRGLVNDLSAAGLGAALTEGPRGLAPEEGQRVVAELNLDGTEVAVEGHVKRVGARTIAVVFTPAQQGEEQSVPLLALLAQLLTRRIELLGPRGQRTGAARLGHQHFYGSGPLNLRVQADGPAWWELSFLDYLVSWSEETGLRTGEVDRAFSVTRATDPLAAGPRISRHASPWRSLRQVGCLIAAKARRALPEQATSLDLVERVLVGSLG